MINHARTLLLNRDGATRPDLSFFGEEVVPTSFSALSLPQGLLTVRDMLFGGHPDNAGINYMLWHYMRLLHSTEFVSYVTALDRRFTYLHNESLLDVAYGATSTPDDGALQFVGDPELGGISGKLETAWLVDRVNDSTFTITNLQSGRAATHTPTITNSATDLMPMTDYAGLQLRVYTAEATVAQWTAAYLARPGIAMDPISRAAQLSSLGASAFLELFPRREPFNLFRELWERHSLLPYKLSGVLLALIYRTEEVRLG